MRLILTVLAIANLRWAAAATYRAEWLYRRGDDALDEAARHKAQAFALMERSGHTA